MGNLNQLTLTQLIYDEETSAKEANSREKLTVAKRNDLIQQMRFNLTRAEQLCVLYAIAQIKPEDDIYQEYELDILQLQKLMGSEVEKNYDRFKKVLKNIRDKSAWVRSSDGKSETVISWFSNVTIFRGSGKVYVKFHEKLQPYLIDLHKQYETHGLHYTTYNLLMVLRMNSRYGIRLYELIKSHRNTIRWSFDLQELKELMCAYDKNGILIMPKSWNDFNLFKTRVLEPAIEDINRCSDIYIDYDVARQGKKVVQVKFFYQDKTEDEIKELLSETIPCITDHEMDIATTIELYRNSKEAAFRNKHKN